MFVIELGLDVPNSLNFLRFSWLARAGAVTKRHKVAAALVVAGGGLAFWAFGHQQADAGAPAAGPVPVEVAVVRPQTVHPWANFSGRIAAVDDAEIRPQVSGRITEIRFRDGDHVKAGQVLFVIDPRPYQAAASKAQGDLASAIHNAKLADLELDRGRRLMAAHALAQENYDQRINAAAVAKAAVQSAEAALAQARVSIDYAYVKAPIAGRVSRAEITLGNLVNTTPSPPLLTSIVSDDGVYADFEIDAQTYLASVRKLAGTPIPVELSVEGDKDVVYRGTVASFDNHIDSNSGTIRARARFANTDGALIPGMFVSVRMSGGVIEHALLVSEKAIGADQNKRFVYVVGKRGTAEYREVTLGPELDGRRVVETGLKPGDRVILDGLQRLMPGVPVVAAAKVAAR